MIRRTIIATLCCLALAACGEKEGSKLGNNEANNSNAQNVEPNNSNAQNVDDPCAGLDLCMASGASCEGNTHVICQVNSDSCIVKTSEIDCVAPDVCDDTLGCITPGDCTDDAGCEGADDGDISCDGDVLIECAEGADGCMDATRNDCSALGQVCSDAGATPMCVMVMASCGDGTVDAGEQCDDGNNMNGDGCDANCMLEAVCGDGNVDAGEQCDDGNTMNGDGCDMNCQLEAVCGDGNVDAGEQCDDGNTMNGDGCDMNCQLESVCGDGNVDAGEQCDDGNTMNGDGCDMNCQLESVCGDGNVDAGEQCDDGNTMNGDGCDMNCQLEAVCGDGNVDAGEQCDDGNTMNGDGCDMNCQLEAVCGDGNLDAGEGCDDGGNVDGDGCDANCQPELGYDCDATGCVMWPTYDPGASSTFTSSMPPEGGVMLTTGMNIYDCTFEANTMGDPDVRIYDDMGALVEELANTGDESINDLMLASGNYYIEVESAGATMLDGFVIDCMLEPVDLGMFSSSTSQTFNSMTDHGFPPLDAGDSDYYRFTVTEDLMLDVDVTSMDVSDDFDISFWTENQDELLNVNIPGGQSTNIYLTPGVYLMRITNHLITALALASYTVALSASPFSPFSIGTYAAGDTINPLSGGAVSPGQAFYLAITFTTAVLLDVTLNGWTSGNMYLFVWGLNGIIAASTTSGFETITALSLVAGTYWIVMMGVEAVNAHGLQLDAN